MISANSPNGFACPGLRELRWETYHEPLTFDRLFVSSRLTTLEFRCRGFEDQAQDWIVSKLVSVIAELQTSSLQSLTIIFPSAKGPTDPTLKSLGAAVSSAILRCGPSFTKLSVPVPLSDAAVQHIMRLPGFTQWGARNGPPDVSDLSLPDTFPKLERLWIFEKASLKWLPFFKANTLRTLSGRVDHAPSNRGPGQNLTHLNSWESVPIDAAFMSPIMLFHRLVDLDLCAPCSGTGGCAFGLTDDDVAEMAVALPNLVVARLGEVCSANTCRTTVASLLILSTHCRNLDNLEIHFSTRDILHDLKSIPEDPRLRDFFPLPRCPLGMLTVSEAPISLGEGRHELVAAGFLSIFPSLHNIYGVDWCRIDEGLEKIRYALEPA
jgi:hypothetical protein